MKKRNDLKSLGLLMVMLFFLTPGIISATESNLIPVADGSWWYYSPPCHPLNCPGSSSGIGGWFVTNYYYIDFMGELGEHRAIVEFDISGLNNLYTSGQIQASLTFTISEYYNDYPLGGGSLGNNCYSLYKIQDAYENGVLESADTSNGDNRIDFCLDSEVQTGDIITFDVTAAIEHDLFDLGQTGYSGFYTYKNNNNWDYLVFYDNTDPINAPLLTITSETDSLVVYYPFSGNAEDKSDSGNHATVNGATLTEDRNGTPDSAYRLDGVDDYITTSLAAWQATQYTLSLWVKASDPVQIPWSSVFHNYDGTPPARNTFQIDVDPDHYRFASNDSNGDYHYLQFGQLKSWWQNLILTYDGTNLKTFINGIEKNSSVLIPDEAGTNFRAFTLARNRLGDRYFKGSIDEVRVYNRALNPDEVLDLYDYQTIDNDSDGVVDYEDNCPNNCNTQQLDADTDGVGDVCDSEPGCGGCGQPACETTCSE